VLLSRDRAGVSGLPDVFWSGVGATTRWRFLLFPGLSEIEQALTLVAVVVLLGALLGIRPRTSSFLSALLLYHLAPLESIIWTASPHGRGLTLATLTLLLCGIAPSGDALARGARPAAPSWQYGWPLRLIQLWLVSVYLLSGVGKVRESGLAWLHADTLVHWLRLATQNDLVAVHRTLGGWIADRPAVAGAVGVGTLLFEFGCVAALFSRRARPWFAAIAIAFHAAIHFTMNIALNSWPLLLVFVDWAALRSRWQGHPPT
jgi:Vitamin K-dependent gamma-carboxylase